jgi:hypothetical protein
MGILGDLTGGFLWKAGAVAGVAAAVGLGVTALVERIELGHVRHDRDALSAQIEKPVTGWRARLAQSEANVATVSAALDDQSARLQALSAADAARLKALAGEVETANRRAATAEARSHQIFNAPLNGATTCDRVSDVDRRLLESLK